MIDEKLMRMALLLKAVDDAEEEMAELRAIHKGRMETLYKEIRTLKYEVLTGQQSLPIEMPPPNPPEKAA